MAPCVGADLGVRPCRTGDHIGSPLQGMLANWTVRRFLTAALNELLLDAEVGVAYVLQNHALSVEKSAVQRNGGAAHFGVGVWVGCCRI
jgi:hypothetical protein